MTPIEIHGAKLRVTDYSKTIALLMEILRGETLVIRFSATTVINNTLIDKRCTTDDADVIQNEFIEFIKKFAERMIGMRLIELANLKGAGVTMPQMQFEGGN